MMMLSTALWDAPYWFRRQHFSRYLANAGWRVFYVEPRSTITRVLLAKQFGFLKRRRKGLPWSLPLRHDRLGVYRQYPAPPCYVRSPFVSRWARVRQRSALHSMAQRFFGTNDYIQVVYHPCDCYSVRGDLPVVFDIVDKFSAYPEFAQISTYMDDCLDRMTNLADTVLATAPSLLPEQRSVSQRVQVIPNGVVAQLFASGLNAQEPADLAPCPAPRAVYAGALFEWFDFNLLSDLARTMPGTSFILLGFAKKTLPPLPPNVHHLGSKKQTDLPAYLARCDVGIIPFVVNELTRHVNPLKFYEYAAAGLPTVSTPMLPLRSAEAPGVLELAEGPARFAKAIQNALANRTQGCAARDALARRHDWTTLADEFRLLLEDVREQNRLSNYE
jgi:glycosyltransferase involved in cell wall biosynthesis